MSANDAPIVDPAIERQNERDLRLVAKITGEMDALKARFDEKADDRRVVIRRLLERGVTVRRVARDGMSTGDSAVQATLRAGRKSTAKAKR